MNSSTLIQKVWNFRHILRDDGVGYGDDLEQLTSLLFLKLTHTNIKLDKPTSLIRSPSNAADAGR